MSPPVAGSRRLGHGPMERRPSRRPGRDRRWSPVAGAGSTAVAIAGQPPPASASPRRLRALRIVEWAMVREQAPRWRRGCYLVDERQQRRRKVCRYHCQQRRYCLRRPCADRDREIVVASRLLQQEVALIVQCNHSSTTHKQITSNSRRTAWLGECWLVPIWKFAQRAAAARTKKNRPLAAARRCVAAWRCVMRAQIIARVACLGSVAGGKERDAVGGNGGKRWERGKTNVPPSGEGSRVGEWGTAKRAWQQ